MGRKSSKGTWQSMRQRLSICSKEVAWNCGMVRMRFDAFGFSTAVLICGEVAGMAIWSKSAADPELLR